MICTKKMQIKRKPIRGFGFLACQHSNCLATTERLLIKKRFGLLYPAVEISPTVIFRPNKFAVLLLKLKWSKCKLWVIEFGPNVPFTVPFISCFLELEAQVKRTWPCPFQGYYILQRKQKYLLLFFPNLVSKKYSVIGQKCRVGVVNALHT